MSNIPATFKATCFFCNTSTIHSEKIVKAAKASSNTEIARRKKRRGNNNNLGKFSEGVIKKYMKAKKYMILKSCTVCDRKTYKTRCRSTVLSIKASKPIKKAL